MIAPAIAIAQHFGDCLTQADYETAYSLLSPELQLHSSPHTLQHTVETMIAYGSGPILRAIAISGISELGVKVSGSVFDSGK